MTTFGIFTSPVPGAGAGAGAGAASFPAGPGAGPSAGPQTITTKNFQKIEITQNSNRCDCW